jgi:hypothetical protein
MTALRTPVPVSFGIPPGIPRPTVGTREEGCGMTAPSVPQGIALRRASHPEEGRLHGILRPFVKAERRAAG